MLMVSLADPSLLCCLSIRTIKGNDSEDNNVLQMDLNILFVPIYRTVENWSKFCGVRAISLLLTNGNFPLYDTFEIK